MARELWGAAHCEWTRPCTRPVTPRESTKRAAPVHSPMTQLTSGQASRLHAATASLRLGPKQASPPLGHKGSDHSRNDPAPLSTQSNAGAQRDVGATGRSVPFTAADRLFRTQRQAVRSVDSGRRRRLAHSASRAAVIRRRLNLDEPLQAGGVDPSELAQLGADHVDAMVPFRHVGRGDCH